MSAPATALAEAIQALDEAAGENYWHVSKGKTRPDEPIFGVAIYPGRYIDDDAEPLAIAEGDDLAATVSMCVSRMKELTT